MVDAFLYGYLSPRQRSMPMGCFRLITACDHSRTLVISQTLSLTRQSDVDQGLVLSTRGRSGWVDRTTTTIILDPREPVPDDKPAISCTAPLCVSRLVRHQTVVEGDADLKKGLQKKQAPGKTSGI
jgi:hypothetical protein